MLPRVVLIIDDEPLASRLLANMLRNSNIQNITETNSPAHAQEIMRCCSFDMIFLDINMPGTNGLDILKNIKPKMPECFVVMFSGESTLENVQKSVALGARSFLVKPFSPEKIEKILGQYAAFKSQITK